LEILGDKSLLGKLKELFGLWWDEIDKIYAYMQDIQT
jgi:hypothetical protein